MSAMTVPLLYWFHIRQGDRMDDLDDNIFDDDDALDYIMSEEVEAWDQQPQGKTGCLGVILILVMPIGLIYSGLAFFTKQL